MIVVTVELHSARTGKVKRLRRMVISNDGTGTQRRGNYDVRTSRQTARVEDYPRLAYPVWELVRRSCEALRKKRSVHGFPG